MLLRHEHNCRRYDVIKVVLVSCNTIGVGAHVKLAAEFNGNRMPETEIGSMFVARKQSLYHSFSQGIGWSQLLLTYSIDMTLT